MVLRMTLRMGKISVPSGRGAAFVWSANRRGA